METITTTTTGIDADIDSMESQPTTIIAEATPSPNGGLMLIGRSRNFQDYEMAGKNNFLKGCKWSPDGLCIATCSDDGRIRLFNTPQLCFSVLDSNNCTAEDNAMSSEILEAKQPKTMAWEWDVAVVIEEGELIYDFAWFPKMNSMERESCIITSCSRDHPTHAWDAFTGELVATYRSYNQYDEVFAPKCIAYTPDGSRLYCGFKGLVHVFDSSKPGRECLSRNTKLKFGINGVASEMCFTDDGRKYAIGYFNGQVHVFSENNGELIGSIFLESGVTFMRFVGSYLYIGMRMASDIVCYDVRNFARQVLRLKRPVDTNQRVQFDVTANGQYLLSGLQNGDMCWNDLWNTSENNGAKVSISDDPAYVVNKSGVGVFTRLHDDCVSSISVHPYLPIFATGSGKRHFFSAVDDHSNANDDEEEGLEEKKTFDNTLKLWELPF
eukprot:m.107416 g.107416  ORF g.107416 m.107416 type:complete len:439 (+) comp9174_c1_seq2:3469-4785(+)